MGFGGGSSFFLYYFLASFFFFFLPPASSSSFGSNFPNKILGCAYGGGLIYSTCGLLGTEGRDSSSVKISS
jgi:hypothetical protein